MLWSALRVASFTLGAVGWAAVLLTQRDEEQRMRNKLVDWWLAVTSTSEGAFAKSQAFSQALAHKALEALEYVFGEKTGRPRFFLGSASITQLAVALWMTAIGLPQQPGSVALIWAWSALLWVALLRRPGRAIALLRFAALLLHLIPWISYARQAPFHTTDGTAPFAGIVLIYVAGFAVDALSVSANRLILRSATTSSRTMAAICLLVVLPSILFAASVTLAFTQGLGKPTMLETNPLATYFAAILALSSTVNLAISICLLATVVALVLNIVTWKTASRLLTNLHDRGPSRSQLAGIATALIALSFAQEPIKLLVKKLGLHE